VGSILLLAVAGTLISTLVVGFGLYGMARLGTIPGMSWAECLAFASLISAVDPVATLSIFRSLSVRVSP
jgi:sodium/hydrogen exchanger 8